MELGDCQPGWLDWPNFRLLGDFYIGKFLEKTEVALNSGLLFSTIEAAYYFREKNGLG
jgi:hypothetical protein